MVMVSRSVIALRIVFLALGFFMLATLIYTLLTDGSPFRKELLTPWLSTTLIDFYVNVLVISVWVAYRESTYIGAILWIALLVCFGSITTCAYIVKKLFDISPQDPLHDPISLVLLRNDDKRKLICSSVVVGRVIFSMLAIMMSVIFIYVSVTDGLPFRMELLTPWAAATLIDFYINITAISVWVAHKEMTWIAAIFWICLLICFGSVATCAYIAIQLFRLSCEEPMYHILVDSLNKPGFTPSK